MAINYALDELLHWENENASLNALAVEFRFSKLSKNLLQDAAKNKSGVIEEMSNLLSKVVLISIYNGNRRFKSEKLSKEAVIMTEVCRENEFESMFNTLNVIIPIYLENLKYPRMIQLFSKKSSRETLLAVAYVISKNNLFHLVDTKCKEVTNLTKQIAHNVSLIADSTNCITLDDIYKEFGDDDSFKTFLNNVFDKIDYNNFSADNVPNGNTTTKGRLFNSKVVNTETGSVKRFNQTMMESLSYWIESVLAFQKELTERAVMLATPKGCKDYDTERLRVGFEMIDSRMDARSDAMLTRANPSIDTVQISNEKSEKVDRKNGVDTKKKSLFGRRFSKESVDINGTDCVNNIKNTCTELSVSSLSDQIIQLQNKLMSLSDSIYRKDRERCSMFSKAATQFKAHKSDLISDKLNKIEGDKSVRIKPSPLEYVLISDDNSFETNMALLAVIIRSLVSEFTRYKFWNLVKTALNDAKRTPINVVPCKSGISVGIYKKPSDIKFDIQQLKSFLTKGISPGNFTNLLDSPPDNQYEIILEFLRSINSQFTNITAQNTSKTLLHTTLFHTFILDQLGHNDTKVTKDTNEPVNVKKRNYSRKLRDVMKHNPTIDLGIFNEWVIEGHLDDIPTVGDLIKLEEDNERDIHQTLPYTPNDKREAEEMEILDNNELCENITTNANLVTTCKPTAYSMEFYKNLALSKNITAPDPSRASRGMGKFVSTVKSVHETMLAKLKKEQTESEIKLQELADELKRVTNCVIID